MEASKLLFHGTAAISVWASYQHALMLRRAERKDPAALKNYLKAVNTEQLYTAHGPAYPGEPYYRVRYRGVCLVNSFSHAAYYCNWAKAEGDEGFVKFTNTLKHGFEITEYEFAVCLVPEYLSQSQVRRYGDQGYIQLVQGLAGAELPFKTPGAVPVVDKDYLLRHELLFPGNFPGKGEEDCASNYLPWRAIKGVALVDYSQSQFRISGFIARTARSKSDFSAALGNLEDGPRIDWANSFIG